MQFLLTQYAGVMSRDFAFEMKMLIHQMLYLMWFAGKENSCSEAVLDVVFLVVL